MREFHCFYRTQKPVPGSQASAVRYPACEWREPGHAEAVALHPMNRFVCSWLTSDVSEVSRCDAVLHAIAQLENHTHTEWFADGDLFCVDFKLSGVQFNSSHVGPDDTAWWNLPEGRFSLVEVKALLGVWRDFLAQAAPH
ncbi:MAG: hypothetical protein ACR2IX_10140 [Limnohabitans sp.]